jgi:hypothetical protein
VTLPLADIRDPDCIASLSPLTFDITGAYVTGASAIVRRVLYRIVSPRGSLVYARGSGIDLRDLENASLSPAQIEGWRSALVREARAVDYVLDATAGLALVERTWIVVVAVVLVDGRTYPLEVGIADAGAALNSLGGLS